jgi:hypothetical protein
MLNDPVMDSTGTEDATIDPADPPPAPADPNVLVDPPPAPPPPHALITTFPYAVVGKVKVVTVGPV